MHTIDPKAVLAESIKVVAGVVKANALDSGILEVLPSQKTFLYERLELRVEGNTYDITVESSDISRVEDAGVEDAGRLVLRELNHTSCSVTKPEKKPDGTNATTTFTTFTTTSTSSKYVTWLIHLAYCTIMIMYDYVGGYAEGMRRVCLVLLLYVCCVFV